jgi:hypothetical protein
MGIRQSLRSALLVAASSLFAPVASAQIVKVGYTDAGGVIGLGNIGEAGLSLGGRFEKIIKNLPELSNGVLGVNVSADFYRWSETERIPGLGSRSVSSSFVPIGVTGNYHFKLQSEKVVPFLGLGLGYLLSSCSIEGTGEFSQLDASSCGENNLYFISRVGIRYFYKPNLALYADAGAGAATISAGVTFVLR